MKKEGSLSRRKNTFEKKRGLYGVFARSPEFRVDLAGRPVYSEPIAGPNLE
jgi:hypothetical protein